jgi:hypothetical protein
VYIIATPNKDQQVYPKRCRSFSRKMRFTKENAGKKDLENFCFRARFARIHEPKGSLQGQLRSRLPLPPTDLATLRVGIHGS